MGVSLIQLKVNDIFEDPKTKKKSLDDYSDREIDRILAMAQKERAVFERLRDNPSADLNKIHSPYFNALEALIAGNHIFICQLIMGNLYQLKIDTHAVLQNTNSSSVIHPVIAHLRYLF